MNAPFLPQVLTPCGGASQSDPPLETCSRYVWEGRFGSMLIEVRGGRTYVNGEFVEPAERSEVSDQHAS